MKIIRKILDNRLLSDTIPFMAKEIMEIIRAEINKGKHTRYAISKATGIDQVALMRIIRGGSCKAETADKLLQFFGYKITKRKRGAK